MAAPLVATMTASNKYKTEPYDNEKKIMQSLFGFRIIPSTKI